MPKVSLILGRPFLATGRALIDMQEGELILRVGDDKVTFSINEAMKHPQESCVFGLMYWTPLF